MMLPPEIVELQDKLNDMGCVVPPFCGGHLGAYAASLRERVRVLSSPEAAWWLHT